MRKFYKDQEDFKRLKWALLKNSENLTPTQKDKLDRAFLRSPELKLIYSTPLQFVELLNILSELIKIGFSNYLKICYKLKSSEENLLWQL